MKRWLPEWWLGYDAASFRKDLGAGITVGIIAIPLAMAFAIASGVKPEYGLYTTIIAGIIIALLGGSRFQIGGPTGAFIPILLAIVLQYGYENLLIAGFMAGALLVIMGLLKLGALIEYIPRPVTIGFTSGIAVIIFTGQVGYFLGLTDLEQHNSFILNVNEIARHAHLSDVGSIATALVCLFFLIWLPKKFPKVPAALVALIAATLFASLVFGGRVPTIGSVFGDIPGNLPAFRFPEITFDRLFLLLGPAVTIALLGSIESLLSAVVADGMTGTRHDSNKELVGQGLANMVAPMFGGIPATGAIARTAANIKSGAVSPLSAVIHGITVLIILLLFAPYASRIPLSGMAAILILVAWNMSERAHFMQLMRMKNSDTSVALLTFLCTVFLNLTVAVGVGLVLAALLFIKRMSELLLVQRVRLPFDEKVPEELRARLHDSVHVYSIEGPLFFGAAQSFFDTMMGGLQAKPKVVILRLRGMAFIDATGEASLGALVRQLQNQGSKVLVSGIQPQPREMLTRTGLYDRIGREHFFNLTSAAMEFAVRDLEEVVGESHFKTV